MAEYLIQDTTLTAIADAIRAKTGGTDPIDPANMPAAIEGIQSGGSGGVTIKFDYNDEKLKYFTYQIDPENNQILLYSILYSVLYEETGSYDVTIPDKIAGLDVVIVCQ